MNLTRLRYFIEAASCGNFSEASRRLYTAQPNLSKQIAQLEKELGFQLFSRNKRAVSLTPAGKLFYDQVRGVPGILDNATEAARSVSRRGEGMLILGILEGQEMGKKLRRCLGIVSAIYPNLQMELERNSFKNLRSGLHMGHYDLIVTLDFDVEEEPGFCCKTITSQQPAIAISRDNPLSAYHQLEMIELKDEDFVVISPEESPVGYNRFMGQCKKDGFVPHIVYEPHTLETLLMCVEMGMGVALLDQNTRLERVDNVRTVPVPGADMKVVAVTKDSEVRPLLQSVLHILTEEDTEEAFDCE